MRYLKSFLFFVTFFPALAFAADPLVKSVEVQTVKKGRDGGTTWFHPRGCTLPDGTVLWTMQDITGSDHFGPVHEMTSADRGKTWSEPKLIAGFDRKKLDNGTEAAVCDVVPEYHAATSTVLAIGLSVNYKNNKFFTDQPPRWPIYCVRDKSGNWSDGQKLLWDDPRGSQIYSNNCAQRITLPNGDLLIPITFGNDPKKPRSVSTLLCSFDGKTITVKKVGNELQGKVGRGFLEPSLAQLDGIYYMTIRAEDSKGYVATSKDGLEWSEPKAWSWDDDGTALAMSTTQQRWLPHSDDLYLVYTRKSEENTAVSRWRTPLYMAKVDRKTLRLVRESERVAVPMTDDPAKGPTKVAQLGNFHTQTVTPEESWITVGEVIPANFKGDLLLARVTWAKPNKLVLKKAEPSPVGFWLGKLKIGDNEMRLVFQIEADGKGKLAAKMISLDQLRAEVPCKTATFAKGKLELDIPLAVAKFTGTLDEANSKLAGEFTQGKASQPLVLDRIEKLPTEKRSQQPMPPFPYRTEEVKFENAAAKIELAGTLTLPKGEGPFTAVVLVTGSGPQDRDETLLDHKPFLVLADHLTRAGIAVLRYDDRGVGKSKGKFFGATSADFATDAYAAVKYLLGRKEIDPKRLGICGHSEGGMIGPMVAADHPDDVTFLVLLAGPGVTGGEILKTQNLDLLREAKVAEADLQLMSDFFDAVLPLVAGDLPTAKLKEAIGAKTEEVLKKFEGEEIRNIAKLRFGTLADAFAEPWMRYFLNFDPAPVLKKVKCPVLALNGALDIQVRAKENLAGITAALKAGGNPKLTVKEFPGMNHLFQACKTGSLTEYAKIEETINPEVLKVVSEWIAALSK